MANFAILRNGKLNLSGGNWKNISDADAHNRRLSSQVVVTTKPGDDDHIDISRTKYNQKRSDGLDDKSLKKNIQNRLDQVGIKTWRKDAVVAREMFMSTSPEYWGDWQKEIDTQAFNDKLDRWKSLSMEYINGYFGKENVVQAVLHLDEKTPHLHVCVVPIIETSNGFKLSAKEQMSRKNLQDMQTGYAKQMEPLGLVRGVEGSKAKHRHYSQYKTDEELKAQITKEVEQRHTVDVAEAGKAGFARAAEQYSMERTYFTKQIQDTKLELLAAKRRIAELELEKQSIRDEVQQEFVVDSERIVRLAEAYRLEQEPGQDGFKGYLAQKIAEEEYEKACDPGPVIGETDYEARRSDKQIQKRMDAVAQLQRYESSLGLG